MKKMTVKAWCEKVTLPTYETGKPEKNPIFLEKRVYQGSSGMVYPNPVIEKIYDKIVEKKWQACFLENEFLRIMILPELGGRVQMAFDKTKNRHFVYYNEVIKPALVGLTGPWLSGGIEFNWPQHHRPSTYEQVDFMIEENTDGSKTVWCNEIERMFRTRGMAGFTIYPDKAYMEIKVKLYNRTSQPQTFLWWANPAVAVNGHYQSVFPPDVHAVFDHGKRDVSKFPVATGTYYKMDYSSGVDISRYNNIPVPTSYMAIESKYDFVGGYEHDTQGGLLHVANHHISPGKKQWTWGNGDFGKAWDRNLTDRNGPYIELMCGVYTDNQPDFSWLMPYEEKAFSQYFMPYRDVGLVKNATKDALLNLEFIVGKAHIKIYTTGIYSGARIRLTTVNKVLLDELFDFSPFTSYNKVVESDPGLPEHEYKLQVLNKDGSILVEWSPEEESLKSLPEEAKAAKDPEEILSNEELFLNGLHLEQYRHATYDPTVYYREAIKRDPGDIRCNNAMGMWLLRRGQFLEAEQHFHKAVNTLIHRNPNPYDGEPLFNLGLSLRFQERNDEAYKYFYKAVWNAAWMDPGYFQLAQIDASNANWQAALENVSRSLLRNWNNHKARHLKTAVLRKLDLQKEALELASESLDIDPFSFGIIYEKYLMGDKTALSLLKQRIQGNIHNYIEIALDYIWAGMYEEAVVLLDTGISDRDSAYLMAWYYKAWALYKWGKESEALDAILNAESSPPDYCFPNQMESVPALELAMKLNPEGAHAPYCLGNFWYNARQYKEARDCFERSAHLDSTFPIVFRNLALVYFNKFNQKDTALQKMERAFELDPSDGRILMELNQLYKKINKPADFQFHLLRRYPNLVAERDDLYLEWIELFIKKKDYQKAFDLIMSHKFHPWEGGEGKVSGAYVNSLVGIAWELIEKKSYREALTLLEKAKVYPENLGEGKLPNAQENKINYWIGCAFEGLKEKANAIRIWEEGSMGISDPVIAWYYNDQQPDTIFYQGLSLLKLDRKNAAFSRFNKLIDFGEKHIFDKVRIDYFAVSLPDLQIWEEDLDRRNKIHCYYMMALGYLGKGLNKKAGRFFKKVLEMDSSHYGAIENRANSKKNILL